MKSKLIFPLVFATLLLQYSNAHALGKFSRACRFDSLPESYKLPAAKFLQFMGANSTYANMHLRSDQAFYWIVESITTDYFQVARYYLFAQSGIYFVGNAGLGDPSRFNLWRVYKSPYSAEEVEQMIRSDPTLLPFYVNRGPHPLYSARAGDPALYLKFTLYGNNTLPAPLGVVKVVGRHSYYDGQLGEAFDYGETVSYDCNTSNWGFGLFDR